MLVKILLMRLDLFTMIKKRKQKVFMVVLSKKDLKELKEEGIDTQMIPWIEDKGN